MADLRKLIIIDEEEPQKDFAPKSSFSQAPAAIGEKGSESFAWNLGLYK
jgi:hypothetical protein